MTEFLDRHNATIDGVRAHIGDALGEPLLVVAAGSVVQGFGNSRSDIDLNVVVDRISMPMAPVLSFDSGLLHDATYFAAQEVRGWADSMHGQRWPASGSLTRADWRRRLNELFHCVRIGHGVVLVANEGWDTWVLRLSEPWLNERVHEWWEVEIARCRLAGRWLSTSRPLLAAQRWSDALMAALQLRAAKAGELYFKPKWLPEKLRRLNDGFGMRAFAVALRLPASTGDATAHISQCQLMLEELGALPLLTDDLHAQLWLAPGVKLRALGRTTVVSRWDLRAVELPRTGLLEGAPIWECGIDEDLSPTLAELFAGDMLWLSLARAP